MKRAVLSGLACAAMATSAWAEPAQDTCRFLDVMGSNASDAVGSLMQDIAPRLTDTQRTEATTQFAALLASGVFAGGSAWRIGAFGDELEEHLVLLRLRGGEVSGARLRYEWTERGLSLVHLEFQRQYVQYMDPAPLMTPEKINCP